MQLTPQQIKSIEKAAGYLSSGAPKRAKPLADKLLKSAPANFDVLHINGLVRYKMGLFSDGLSFMLKAKQLQPNNAELRTNIASAYQALNDYEKAIDEQEVAVKLNGSVENNVRLAKFLASSNRVDQAILVLKHLGMQKRLNDEARVLLCKMCQRQGRYLDVLDIAEGFKEKSAAYLMIKMEAKLTLNYVEEAESLLDKVVALGVTDDMQLAVLAEKYIQLGNKDKAEVLRLKLSDKKGYQYYYLSLNLGQYEDVSADDVLNLIENGGLSDKKRKNLYLSLARTVKKTDKKAWFRYLEKSNGIRSKLHPYDEALTLSLLENAVQAYKDHPLPVATETTKRPIFIVGMPRSGTTLTESILGAHSECFACGESPALSDVILYMSRGDDFGHRSAMKFIELLPDYDESRINTLATSYAARMRQHSMTTKHTIDKMPHNFLFLPFIAAAFPEAKIVWMQRNPISVILSIFEQNFAGFHSYGNNLEHLVAYYKKYQEYMAEMQAYIPDGMMYTQGYEDLVADPETQIRTLLDFCGLPFEKACLEFHKQKRSVKTASVQQVRQKIYTDSVKSWEGLEEELEPVLSAFPEYK